ncbi:MAG: polysaccharide biosynthesis/export family protein, partial [Campylobacterota bacterium]|nr:polysaccharide biosynthesis/export family protein [Campylobacterota bacterium]
IVLISTLFFSACSIKDDRLFQNARETDISVVSDKQYQDELKFEYKIAPNDRLSVTTYVQSVTGSQQLSSMLANSDITRQGLESVDSAAGLLVTQKGTIRLPLIGSIKVTGLTEDQASKMLINEYKKYIRNPYVTVEITNQRIIVIGEVNEPGIVPVVNGTMNLIEVIARSGYLTKEAERTNIHVIRGNLRDPDVMNYDLTDARSLLSSSLLLKPNDIVYVEARQMDGINKAFNETVPFLTTVSAILAPFVQWTVITGVPIK